MVTHKKRLDFFRLMLVVLVFLTIGNFWYVNIQRDYDEHYIMHSTALQILSQRIAKHAEEAINGNEVAFIQVKENANNFVNNLMILKLGIEDADSQEHLPPSPPDIQAGPLKNLIAKWQDLDVRINIILKNESSISEAETLSKSYAKIFADIEKYLKKIVTGVAKGDPKDVHQEIKAVLSILQETEEFKTAILDVLDVNSTNSLDILLPDKLQKLEDAIINVKQSNPENTTDDKLANLFSDTLNNINIVKANINNVLNIGRTLDIVYDAKAYIYDNSLTILNLAAELETAYRENAQHRVIDQTTAYILSILMFLSMAAWFYMLNKENKLDLKNTEERNKIVQNEIKTLLEELQGLAKGDLTVHLEIREGITKEIASAINYSVNALRHVVANINETTQETFQVTEESKKVAKDLEDSSGHQAKEISETTDSVRAMVTSIEEVSSNASKSESVALESVKIAHDGGKVVRDTITGMERIQTQIQETSEKIRRLSESSQEIGEIITLIDGISEQTNILSLNAAIQAATAGEAGRGFAVVADEVQQLAEKASSATKEINSIVKSIQTDTSQVINAMEQTRSEVVQGVTLAQNAGEALEKIENVSHTLSDLVHNISMSAREQASMSNRISSMMNIIKEIAGKTASGTLNMVAYISKLTRLSTDLRHSVSEFKLPKTDLSKNNHEKQ